jgi:regulator of RNase E activity RraB
MADWSSYFARMEGSPISIAVDLGLRDSAPVEEKPTAYTVAVALRSPDEHGMTSEVEYRALQAIEEELAGALQPYGIIEVGRVTGRGMRTFHYYGPPIDGDIAEMVHSVMEGHADYKYRALSASDPTWTIYTAYLYPDENQLAFANDMKALQALLDAGDDFERARPIEHTIRFDDVEKRDVFARAMADHGYQVAIDEGVNTVRCRRSDTIDPFKITEMRTALTTLAEEFGGFYSGWATVIQDSRR